MTFNDLLLGHCREIQLFCQRHCVVPAQPGCSSSSRENLSDGTILRFKIGDCTSTETRGRLWGKR